MNSIKLSVAIITKEKGLTLSFETNKHAEEKIN